MAPTDKVGYWGVPTSTIDWCENNYEVNFYIAEMWNTLSNLVMIISSLWGMSEVVKKGFDQKFIFCHFLLLTVGLGSWAFHMTLLYEMQLFDELPMVYGTCVHVYCLFEVRSKKKMFFSNMPLLGILSTYAGLFTALYLLWPQPVFQHTSYGILVFLSFGLEMKIIRQQQCRVCRKLFLMSVPMYFFGFFLWNIDNIFCSNLKFLRSKSPSALSPVTQLHAWWHFFAGYGTYLQIMFCIHSCHDFQKEKEDTRDLEALPFGYTLRWKERTKSQ